MNYPTRLSIAFGAATCIVAGTIAGTPRLLRNIDAAAIVVPEPRPIQLDLRDLQPLPPEPEEKKEPPKRLIDSGAAAEAPVRETDLISSQDSQAQDMSGKQGDDTKPVVEEVDDFEEIGAAPSAPAPPPTPPQQAVEEQPPAQESPAAEAAPQPAAPEPAPQEETPNEPVPEPKPAGEVVPEEMPPAADAKPAETKTQIAEASPAPKEEPKPTAPKPEEKQPPERFQVAAAQPQVAQPQEPQPPSPPAPQVPVQELRATKGRDSGEGVKSGFTSFEANKHALGEYMLKVRNAVERQWRTALHLRYSGVSATDATIKCSIRPDGTLEFVTIMDAGSSLTYAVLCREAIEKAGPFEPFPFDVPEIYRNENLEINWKFSYM